MEVRHGTSQCQQTNELLSILFPTSLSFHPQQDSPHATDTFRSACKLHCVAVRNGHAQPIAYSCTCGSFCLRRRYESKVAEHMFKLGQSAPLSDIIDQRRADSFIASPRSRSANKEFALEVHGLMVSSNVSKAMNKLCTHIHVFKSWTSVGGKENQY